MVKPHETQGFHPSIGRSEDRIAITTSRLLKQGEFTQAVLLTIGMVSVILAQHFPREPDGKNELPNQIVRD